MRTPIEPKRTVTRRSVLAGAFASLGGAALSRAEANAEEKAGIVGLGEPVLEGRALTCAQAIKEIEPYLVGKDPRQVVHHWQAIYRHAFYRGGPILTSALSGIDMALWDIKGEALGVPVY